MKVSLNQEAIARVAETQGQQPVVKLPFKDLADGGCEELAEVLKRSIQPPEWHVDGVRLVFD